MKAYYLIVAVAASLAALAMATQLNDVQTEKPKDADLESEMEAWFI